MKPTGKMTPLEMRASLSLASIFALRMLGMFIILPVFALYATHLPGGDNKALMGMALGAYGLTQAFLQIPLGWLSDRIGRKPVIAGGLVIFALGSFIAASATNIQWIILGRAIQGSGAIASAIVALVGDLTRESHRTKAMAMIGVTIGLTFSASMILAPMLYPLVGVPGLFTLTGVFSLLAILMVFFVVPSPGVQASPPRGSLGLVLKTPELLRLDMGIFILHANLMATFVVVPSALVHAGFAQPDHWKVYLPVMVVSFILMIPGVALSHGKHRKTVLLACAATLVLAQIVLLLGLGSLWGIAAALLLFFITFNVLEASLPSMITTVAPPGAKGAATGVFSSSQFLGVFFGASLAGLLSRTFGPEAVPIFSALLSALWFLAARAIQFKKPD